MSSTRIERNRGNGVKGGQFGFARDPADPEVRNDRANALSRSQAQVKAAQEELVAQANDDILSELDEYFDEPCGLRWVPNLEEDGCQADWCDQVVVYDSRSERMGVVFLDGQSGEVYTVDDAVFDHVTDRFVEPTENSDRVRIGNPEMWDQFQNRYEARIEHGGVAREPDVHHDPEMVPWRHSRSFMGTRNRQMNAELRQAFDRAFEAEGAPHWEVYQHSLAMVTKLADAMFDDVAHRTPAGRSYVNNMSVDDHNAVVRQMTKRWKAATGELREPGFDR